MTIKEMCEAAYELHCELCRKEGYIPISYAQFERDYMEGSKED